MIFIKKIIHTAIRQIGKTFRLTQHIPGHHNRDKRLPIHTTNSNAIRIVVNNLYGHSSESNHYLPPFASSLIMHVLTNAEKLIPRRDAASLAESRKLAGIRIVTGTTSPFTRYERISVSPASCSIRSEYVIAFYTFKLQYKCNNSTPAWEQRKLGEIVSIGAGAPPSAFSAGNFLYVKVDDLNESSHFQFDSAQRVDANTAVKPIRKGSIIFAKRGAAILGNKVRVLGKTAYIDTNMMALEPRGVDADFLWLFINQTGLYRIADTSTIPQINNKHIEPYPVDIPNMAEQQAIGTFFSRLDDLITLHQRKRLSIRQRSPVWS